MMLKGISLYCNGQIQTMVIRDNAFQIFLIHALAADSINCFAIICHIFTHVNLVIACI